MNNLASLHDQETKAANKEEEEEDALSFCDFPLNRDETAEGNKDSAMSTHHRRRSSSQTSEYAFEFSSDTNFDYMSHAEDIIHCGKLVPYRHQQQPLFDHQILRSLSEDYDSADLSRRYCDSLPTSKRLTRSSRSLDRERLRRNSSMVMRSEASDSRRSSVSKGLVKSKSESSKPRWYGLMFGLVKIPSEIDLQDMKNRQVRRRMLDDMGGECRRRSSWGHDLLRVLSCKNHSSSVAVTASIGLVQQL